MTDKAITRLVILLIVASFALRELLAATTGLGFDKSYMLGNARIFMLSYVDQVPMHLWMAGAARWLTGSEAPGIVRLPFVLAFAGSTWLMFTLTRRLFSARAGLWAVVAFNLAPVFSLSHASWILADGPLIFFLLATANVVAADLRRDADRRTAGRSGGRWRVSSAGSRCCRSTTRSSSSPRCSSIW